MTGVNVTNQRKYHETTNTNFVVSSIVRRFVTERKARLATTAVVAPGAARGFTLIELLVVIAIIAILSTIATVSLTQARQRARDTKRVADIQQVRSALVLYSNARADYPPAASTIPQANLLTLGSGNAACLDSSDDGFRNSCPDPAQTFMGRVPADIPASRAYKYWKAESNTYNIQFELEDEIGDFKDTDNNNKIECNATQQGITCN